MKMNKKILASILTLIAVGCLLSAGFLFFHYTRENRQSESALEEVRPSSDEYLVTDIEPIETPSIIEEVEEMESVPDAEDVPDAEGVVEMEDVPETEGAPETTAEALEESTSESAPMEVPAIPNPYAESFLANEDMAGWLVIPGTKIDYPIMWTPEDEEYYLYRDFNKKDNSNGCLILDTDSSVNPLTTNLIIHGHNMKSGAMFGNLTDYEDENYYKEHRQIILHTKECQHNYEVIAVFRSQVYKKTDKVFKFYKFFQADTEEEFDDFYKNIKNLSLYDTGVTAEFGDHFITLSTCTYHVERGRFVVVAKEVEPGDNYLPIEQLE